MRLEQALGVIPVRARRTSPAPGEFRSAAWTDADMPQACFSATPRISSGPPTSLQSAEAVAQSREKVTVPVMVGGASSTSLYLEPLSQSKRRIGRY
jgi:hypothetical protein